jgi:hypothetical protein
MRSSAPVLLALDADLSAGLRREESRCGEALKLLGELGAVDRRVVSRRIRPRPEGGGTSSLITLEFGVQIGLNSASPKSCGAEE